MSVVVYFCRKTVCVEGARKLKKVWQRGLQLLNQHYSMVGFLYVVSFLDLNIFIFINLLIFKYYIYCQI